MNVAIEEVKERIYADRTKVLEELQSIEKRDGVVTPQAVVDFARSEDTELHREFDWDNTSAAEKYRLQQARQIIKAVVVDLTPNKNPTIVNAYFHFREDEYTEQGYISMSRVLNDTELYQRMLSTAKREAKTFSDKYASVIVWVVVDFLERVETRKHFDSFLSRHPSMRGS